MVSICKWKCGKFCYNRLPIKLISLAKAGMKGCLLTKINIGLITYLFLPVLAVGYSYVSSVNWSFQNGCSNKYVFKKCPTSVRHVDNPPTTHPRRTYNECPTSVQQIYNNSLYKVCNKCPIHIQHWGTTSVQQVCNKSTASLHNVQTVSNKCSTTVLQVFSKCSNSVSNKFKKS